MVVYQMSTVTRGKRRLVIEQSPDDLQADAKTTKTPHAIGDSAARMQEEHEHSELAANGVPSYLYPPLTDPNFNVAIVSKKEFADLRTDARVYDPEMRASQLCLSAEFELLPHQAFVRNFLSFRTPYNGLLLFHGLGTGKTCSAISVTEEMRGYLKQIGVAKRIIIVASPNVQENFKRQLFDERQLVKKGSGWTLKSCAGDEMLREINPTGMLGLERATIVRLIKQIIKRSYLFMGPEQFSNYISRIMERYSAVKDTKEKDRLMAASIEREFSNRLLVIDEVHNIRVAKGGVKGFNKKGDKVAKYLQEMVRHTKNLKLLLMSATPMFNSPNEIVWLINLLRLNDKRPPLLTSDVFDQDGAFRMRDGDLVGRDDLVRASRGYVSYVRGDNPYAFPFKLFPAQFAPDASMLAGPHARTQLNGAVIAQSLQYLDLYKTVPEGLQLAVYQEAVRTTASRVPHDQGLGYQVLNLPLQALDIVFPVPGDERPPTDYIGRTGLQSSFTYDPDTKRRFAYKYDVEEEHGRFLSPDKIGGYSAKIAAVCEAVLKSTGIVLIYSQYIDGGCVPIALALEELGLRRTVGDSLFADAPAAPRDALTMKSGPTSSPATYAMITGDQLLSPDNATEVRKLTNAANTEGQQVKVVIISEAGSEGIDLTNIRQVHILDPWYNLSRLQQIVGRGVRWCSHSSLPFEQRNVEIRYYGSVLPDESVEAADVYMYRLAERKAVLIGAATRALKETAVDCLLNKIVLTPDRMRRTVVQKPSSGGVLDYIVGDRERTSLCDFMDDCNYACIPDVEIPEHPNMDTYTDGFVTMNIGAVEKRVVEAFTTRYAINRGDLVSYVNARADYPLVQVDAAITRVLNGSGPPIVDMLGRPGRMVNIGEYYLFQPADLAGTQISMYERRVPIPNKPLSMTLAAKQRNVESGDTAGRLLSRLERQYGHVQREHDFQKIAWSDLGKAVRNRVQDKERWAQLLATVSTAEYDQLGEAQRFYREIRTDLKWHKLLGNALQKPNRLTSIIDLTKADVLRYVVDHSIDILPLDDKIRLFTAVSDGSAEKTPFAAGLLEGYVRRSYDVDGVQTVVLADPGKALLEYFVVNGTKLVPATPVQRLSVVEHITAIPKVPLAKQIGLMVATKGDGLVVFKIRDTGKPRAQGHRCDQKGRADAVRTLNAILEREAYSERLKNLPSNPKELCTDEELILRHFDTTGHQGLRWFMGLEESIRTNLGRSR